MKQLYIVNAKTIKLNVIQDEKIEIQYLNGSFTDIVPAYNKTQAVAILQSSLEESIPDHTCEYTVLTLKEMLELSKQSAIDEGYVNSEEWDNMLKEVIDKE